MIMVYRKITTHCGNDILEKLSEEETAVYYREKRNQNIKEDRKAEVGAYVGSLFIVGWFAFMFISWAIGG